ncbi:lipid-A-disaccharide synthase [Aliidiomarina celeris]|uniref:lipid-A-disaccharide synthase n=1 Tax=Aliidiomarina celeris TaxID=2249428 RepID=UPI000DE9424E|nr:lipid-A-disaccharide synthase [Aliidiomarina celeris]
MPDQASLCIGIVAGESSGDILGANLIKSLKQQHSNLRFVGIGGPLMEAEGLQSILPMETLSVMGIVDVLKNLPALLRARRQVVQTMLRVQPAVFIGVDAPDFNLPIEKKLKAKGIKTAHYVSPSVWAWRPKRIFNIQKATHDVFSILPFEAEFYAQYQVPCTFVGHPLADEIPMQSNRDSACAALGLHSEKTYIALLPGSRGSEAGMLTRDFLEAAHLLKAKRPELEFLLAYANDARKKQIEALLTERDRELVLHTFDGMSRTVMLAAESCVLASGTVSLEAMLLKRPMVVCYRFGALNYRILKRFIRVAYFSLPNLLANSPLVKELLQDQVTPQAIAGEIERLLQSDNTELLQQFQALHEQIRCNAGAQAAARVLALAEQA